MGVTVPCSGESPVAVIHYLLLVILSGPGSPTRDASHQPQGTVLKVQIIRWGMNLLPSVRIHQPPTFIIMGISTFQLRVGIGSSCPSTAVEGSGS